MIYKRTIQNLFSHTLCIFSLFVFTTEAILAQPQSIINGTNIQAELLENNPTPLPTTNSPLTLLNTSVPPATATTLSWLPEQSLAGLYQPTPVLFVNGAQKGPTLCLTAAIHGDELNGIEIVRRILHNLNPEELSGAVIGVPIVNLQGFQRASRYLIDRRDLNRYFPGTPRGSSASRIAYSFFNEVIRHCNILIDIHTGSAHRTNLPQIRADLENPAVITLTKKLDNTVILHSSGTVGTLRRAAVRAGIPAITLETGRSLTLQEPAINNGVTSIKQLLNKLEMLEKTIETEDGHQEMTYHHSSWIRINYGGLLFGRVELGDDVKKGQLLGTVTDPITNIRKEIVSPYNGKIIGKAVNQVVMPGFAGFHIGIKKIDANDNLTQKEIKLPTNPQNKL